MEHEVHLIGGGSVIIRGSVIAKDDDGRYLTLETENALYRFWWANVLYYVSRHRGHPPQP